MGTMIEMMPTELTEFFVYCKQNPDLVCIVLLNLMWQGYIKNSEANQSTIEQ